MALLDYLVEKKLVAGALGKSVMYLEFSLISALVMEKMKERQAQREHENTE